MDKLNRITVLIPAYKPDEKLLALAKQLLEEDFLEILIVDDGSGASFSHIFDELDKMGCRVLAHAINMGKGRALKTGFNDLCVRGEAVGVVTADADGQHLVSDIKNVAEALLASDNTIVLGKRVFSEMPLRSRCGNSITRTVFNFVSGQKIYDTQTGLRAFPVSSLPALLALSGERYEYEMNMLLETSNLGLKLSEIEIQTVYINDNRGSHFNTLKDSWRIYRQILLFVGSSMFCFLLDYGLYALFLTLIPKEMAFNVVIAYIGARIISSAINFLINRNMIFAKDNKKDLKRHLIGYYLLVVCIMLINTALVEWLSHYVNEYIAKLPVELVMFFVSFIVQKKFIFK